MCNLMPTSLTKLTKTTTTTLYLNNIMLKCPARRAHSSRRRYLMHAGLRKELGARHSLLNLSVHDLVEEFARYVSSQSVYAVFKCLASSSNLSTTTRCANSSGLSRSSSRNYPQRNYSLRLLCLIYL
ncbi:hypothetical protein HBI72_153800 [Parastagonospora nodorum]|nr:hypothetical protein HBI72_153800 [Parastagonospora nodorum]